MQRSTTEQRRYCTGIALHDLNNRWLQYTLALVILLFSLSVRVQAGEPRQDITLSLREATLDKVFKEIRKQTGYSFVYTETEIQRANKVTIQVSNSSLDNVLSLCFRNQPLTYTIVEKIVVVKPKAEKPAAIAVVNNIAGDPKKITMRGRVMNEKGEPLAGATITVRRTDMNTTTDHEGYFSLTEVEEDAVLVVSSVGHVTQQMKIRALNMEIRLPITVKEEEEVVVAYNKISQRSNVGAVTVVKGEEIQNLPNRSVDKSLQGLVPGLLVTSGSGQPGGGLSNFVLRGIATAGNAEEGSTVRNPLIVIDGIPVSQDAQQLRIHDYDVPVHNPMAQLNPSDIESISILKDAAAIALYGSKASNGVILITTKQGQAGKTRFSLRHQTDITQRLKGKVELLNEEEYMELLLETYKNTYPTATTDSIIGLLKELFPVRADGSFYPFQNLSDQVYNNAAITTSNELSISGGSQRSTFYLGLEWTKQNGTYRKTGYDRKSIRFNFTNKVTDWLKIGLNSTMSYNQQDYSSIETTDSYGFVNAAAPLNPAYLETGDLFLNYTIPYDAANPIAAMKYNSSRNTSYRALNKLFAELSFLRYFKLNSNIGVDFQLTEAKERRDPRLYDSENENIGKGRITEGRFRTFNLISTNTLTFSKLFSNNHSLNALIAQEAQILSQKRITAMGVGIRFLTNDQIDNTTTRNSSGNSSKQTLLSYFGQANYSYKNKYFASSSIRLDGSSKFGRDQRMGTYWSTGIGWVISAEPFMASTQSWLNYLKIRGSVGAAGNSGPINKYTKYSLLTAANYLNTSTIAIYPQYQPYNPNIKWEETFTWDAGLETKLWEERVGFTLDLYQRKTYNVIYMINIPLVSGYQSIYGNMGDMENKGIEISLSATIIKTKDFNWNINANWSKNQNRLVKSNIKLAQTGLMANEEGRNFNSYYMPVWVGVDPSTGLGQWIDSTGKPNSDYNAAKLQFVGKPQPDGFGAITHSFTFKNIQLSAQFYYQYGFQLYGNADLINDGARPYANQAKEALNRWQKPGDVASNPKRTLFDYTTYQFSTRRLYDGDHIRLQNVAFAYNFSNKVIKLLHVNSLKVYAQANNVAVWAKARGEDASNADISGQTGSAYPNSRTYTLGINLNF